MAQRAEWTTDDMWDGIAIAVGEPFDDVPKGGPCKPKGGCMPNYWSLP